MRPSPAAILGVLAAACTVTASTARAQQAPATELLWPKGAPGAKTQEPADKPTLTIHLPPAGKANGCGIVICPGGGYGFLALDHEGKQVAEWLNSIGVAAYILSYRIAPRYRHPAPLDDVRRALRTVRSRAAEWKLDPQRLGIIGFSAGGHLAATAGTHFIDGKADAADPVERASSRPDFMILAYPVISFKEPWSHAGSRKNLLGDPSDPALVETFSLEIQVTPVTPPAFIFHTTEDTGVPPENSVAFYLALRKAKVPAELHIYEKGPHGVGLAPRDPVLSTWPERCRAWMQVRGYLGAAR